MRPGLCHLGGAIADGVLLNWMPPAQATQACRWVHEGAQDAGVSPPTTALYVRVAVGSGASQRLRAEEGRYRTINEGHRRHFAAMDVPLGSVGVAAPDRRGVLDGFRPYESAVDLPIVRVLAGRGCGVAGRGRRSRSSVATEAEPPPPQARERRRAGIPPQSVSGVGTYIVVTGPLGGSYERAGEPEASTRQRRLNMIARRVICTGVGAIAAVALWAGPALASDHLANGTDAPGAGQRDFANPVAQNPSGTSAAAALPGTVPGEGNPNAGAEQSTPAVDLSEVGPRSGDHAQP